jgi:hypothetical protein
VGGGWSAGRSSLMYSRIVNRVELTPIPTQQITGMLVM